MADTTATNPPNPQVPSSGNVRIDGPVSITTLYARDPVTARDYTVFKNETAQQLTEQRLAEAREASGGDISVSEQAQIAARAEADATLAANEKYQVEIVKERAAFVVPADTPPPTTSAGSVSGDPQSTVPPTRVVAVSTETLLQNDPETAREYTEFKTQTAQQLTEQRIAEARAAAGGDISVSEQVQIAARANIDATADANARYQDQIEAARAGTSVPADTPPPAASSTSVSPTVDPEVPPSNDRIETVSQTELAQQDPALYQQWQRTLIDKASTDAANTIAAEEATLGRSVTAEERETIESASLARATAETNTIYQNELRAANVVTTVPADTPPPTTVAPEVSSSVDPEVPAENNRIDGPVSITTLYARDPITARDYTVFKNETAQELTEQRLTEAREANGGDISVSEQAQIAARAEADATAAANSRYQVEIVKERAAFVVPADTPPPTTSPGSVSGDPQATVPAATITRVSTETFRENNPEAAEEYIAFKDETAKQLTEQRLAEAREANGGEISVSEQVQIAARANIDATSEANFRYQDQIEEAGAAETVPVGTRPPTTSAPAVDSTTNQQVPSEPAGEQIIDPDTGEVIGYFDSETGDAIETPPVIRSGNDPQVPNTDDTQISSVNQSQLSQSSPSLYTEYNSSVENNTAAAERQLTNQALATYGVSNASDLPLEIQAEIREQAQFEGETQATAEFKEQLEGSGAATTEPEGTAPPTVAPAPPSPSPYEIFLAQEAAATTAAEAEAAARFASQFDDEGNIVGSSDDPQTFAIDVEDEFEVIETEAVPVFEEFSGYEDFYGIDEFNNVGEFEALPPEDDFTSYDDFYGNDVGEFQDLSFEPEVTDFSGYDEFYGDDTGEFQDLSFEPEPVEFVDYGEFIGGDGGDPLGDLISDIQSEPDTGDGESAGFSDFFGDFSAGAGDFASGLLKSFAGPVSPGSDPQASILDSVSALPQSATKTPAQLAAERQAAAVAQAKAQQQVNAQRKQANEGDWRVRLRLAGGADYLYKAKDAGILEPLAVTDGVIFPYTPQITTQYVAKYNPYELTHSNYKGYFYQGSSVNEVNITAQFTAQDTDEANYLLAVIHFFRSVTKMFYGQDDASKRGAPPPLVFLQGLGEYQFNLHPCVVSSFNYTLPADVDYIRAKSVNYNGTNLLQRRDRQNLPIGYVPTTGSRLANAGLTKGGLNTPPPPPTLGTNSPTYVPTKMEIQLVLLPVQTRSQVSQQFSLKQFANGDLIRGGFW